MSTNGKSFPYAVAALLCGLWFLFTAWMWTYMAALFVAYPVGLLGLFFWSRGRKQNPESPIAKIALAALIVGLLASAAAFLIHR